MIEDTWARHAALLRDAFEKYLLRMDRGQLEPSLPLCPYDFEAEFQAKQWRIFGDWFAIYELMELTNSLNAWHTRLVRWHAWNTVLNTYPDEDAWDLRIEFLDPLAQACLLSPSSIRDKFLFVATNSLHQVRLGIGSSYKDRLDEDSLKGRRFLSRKEREDQLARLAEPWNERAAFLDAIRSLDDRGYKDATHDFRNRLSHAIEPRLGHGITQIVQRKVVEKTRAQVQPDGTYSFEPVAGKTCVQYGFGGTPPLDLEGARVVNLDQYVRARRCLATFRSLMSEAVQSLPMTNVSASA